MLLARRAARRLARDVARVVPPFASERLHVAQDALEGVVPVTARWMTVSDEPRLPFVAAVDPDEVADGSPASFIVKVATDPVGIQRLVAEASVLEGLAADDRLGDWRALVPTLVMSRALPDRHLTVQQRLPGRPLHLDDGSWEHRRLDVATALDAIAPMHVATARSTTAEQPFAAAIDAPLERVARAVTGRTLGGRPMDDAIRRLRDHLANALLRRPMVVSRVHRDYWPGNILVRPASNVVEGIVDWEAATVEGSPVIDTVGMWVAARRRAARRSTGEQAAALLTDPGEPILADVTLAAGAAGLDVSTAVLLAWLAAIDGTLTRYPWLAAGTWIDRNIAPVVEASP
ncbi:MAG: phosphotransferase family protein [Chloroflexota bacterium]